MFSVFLSDQKPTLAEQLNKLNHVCSK